MRWRYNSIQGNWNDFEDVVYAITSDVMSKLENHTIDDYYIFKEDKLYKVIKGCEIDPLTVYAHNWTEEQKIFASHRQLPEFGETFEEKWEHISELIFEEYTRTEEDLKEIEKIEKLIQRYGIRKQMFKNNYIGKFPLVEYEIKYNFNVPFLNEIKVHLRDSEHGFKDIDAIKDYIKETCGLNGNDENCCYILGLNSNNDLLGLIKVHRFDNEIFRFLILLGCSKYMVVQNDYYGNDFYTDEDTIQYLRLRDSNLALGFWMLGYYRITRNRDLNIQHEYLK